jgi:ankyrin repeat protein
MSDSTPVAPDNGATRQLPATPSLEFERKRAKTLLRRLRRHDPSAQLADAQFQVARELGFASWPRLTQYFHTLERQVGATRPAISYDLEHYNGWVQGLLSEHRRGREWGGRAFAAYVPRFFGKSIAEVLASPVTIDDARLVVARQRQCASWEKLLDAVATHARESDPWKDYDSPFAQAFRAMKANDFDAFRAIVDTHPELLRPSDVERSQWRNLMYYALIRDRRTPSAEAHRFVEWLEARGMDRSLELNRMLLGGHGMTVNDVQYLLDRGADPNWVPPNGVTVLEHALLRYHAGASIDLLAKHVAPPKALWIAAGLGDVDAVRRYFDRDGKPISAAYENRPPFHVMGEHSVPSLPDPDQQELLAEVAMIAAMNGRTAVVELLIDRGFPIDYIGWGGTSMLSVSIAQKDVAMVEMLVRRGADLDKKGEMPHASPREFARMVVPRFAPDDPDVRRILELCSAGTVEEALAEAERDRRSPPTFMPQVLEAFELAGDDAYRQGQSEIHEENILIGLLRNSGIASLLGTWGIDLTRLCETIGDRLRPGSDRLQRPKLPFDTRGKAVAERSIAIGEARRYESITVYLVLAALVEHDDAFTTELLRAYGSDIPELRKTLAEF